MREILAELAPDDGVTQARFEEPGDSAVAIGPKQERSELLTDVDVVTDYLYRLRIEIAARQVALPCLLIDDFERQDLVRVVKERLF